MNKFCFKICAPLLLISSLTQVVGAYEFTGARWGISEGQSIDYYASVGLCAGEPAVSDDACLAAIKVGYDVWSELTCAYMQWSFKGRTESTSWGVGDGQNIASWRQERWDDSSVALAITSSIWAGGGNTLVDADIKFNGVHHRWSTGEVGSGTDIASVSTHEVGHAIGLDHSDVQGSAMWPSTAPGDTSGRTLHRDDMEAACALYPTGGAVPEAVVDQASPSGDAQFGEDCQQEACMSPYYCIRNGEVAYCSQNCTPGGRECPEMYHCAYLSDGSGTCVKGPAPMSNRAVFGERCGNETLCESALICVRDSADFYCSKPCDDDTCPNGYFCASIVGGNSICARGQRPERTQRPGFGEPCSQRGLCDLGHFCLTDALFTDAGTGDPIPYCSKSCASGVCPADYRCVDIPPRGTACQKVPSVGDGVVGDPCWIDPEEPWLEPTCSEGLVCVDFQLVDGVVEARGYCTQNCDADRCCPMGWGCAAVTPVFAQCRPSLEDSEGFECAVGNSETVSEPRTSDTGGGCATKRSTNLGELFLAVGLVIVRIRKRGAEEKKRACTE